MFSTSFLNREEERDRKSTKESERKKEEERICPPQNRKLRHAKLESVICSSLDRFQVSIVHK